MGGAYAAQGREGKIVQVYRRKWVIHIERITRDKTNGENMCRGLAMVWDRKLGRLLAYSSRWVPRA